MTYLDPHIVAWLYAGLLEKFNPKEFILVVNQALAISWTRDPFDRVIVAQAGLTESMLISKDQNILANYLHSRW